jgi:hypothetical protein
MTVSFHIHSNSLLINHPIIRRYAFWSTEILLEIFWVRILNRRLPQQVIIYKFYKTLIILKSRFIFWKSWDQILASMFFLLIILQNLISNILLRVTRSWVRRFAVHSLPCCFAELFRLHSTNPYRCLFPKHLLEGMKLMVRYDSVYVKLGYPRNIVFHGPISIIQKTAI